LSGFLPARNALALAASLCLAGGLACEAGGSSLCLSGCSPEVEALKNLSVIITLAHFSHFRHFSSLWFCCDGIGTPFKYYLRTSQGHQLEEGNYYAHPGQGGGD